MLGGKYGTHQPGMDFGIDVLIGSPVEIEESNDELDHYIEALILAEEAGVSIYIERGFLEDILPGCARIAWM